MKNLVKIICETLNIKPSDTVIVARITERLKSYPVMLQARFVKYCEKHFVSEEVRFLSGYQKFLELSRKFEEGVVEIETRDSRSEAEIRAKELVEKIENSKSLVEKYVLKGFKLNYEHIACRGKRVFSKDDMSLLERVQGDLSSCLYSIEAFGSRDLEERIAEEITKSIRRIGRNSLFLTKKDDDNTFVRDGAVNENLSRLTQKIKVN